MPNTPSKPSSSNHEAPKGSGFRTMIFLLLGTIAASGVGGYVLGKLSKSKQDKPDITDTKEADYKPISTGISLNKCEYDLAKMRSMYYATLNKFYSECDQSGSSSPDCKNLTSEDINKLVINERLKAANRIIQDLCLSDKDDMEAIENAAKKGCTEFDIHKNLSEGLLPDDEKDDKKWKWTVDLKRPEDPNGMCDIVILNQSPPPECRPAGKKIARKTRQETEKQYLKEKEIAGLLKQKNYTEAMKGIDPKIIKDDARRLGLDDSEVMKEFIDITERAQAVLSGNPDEKKRKLLACEMVSMLAKLDEPGKPDPSLKKISKSKDSFPFDTFQTFAEEFAKAQGLNDAEECILQMNDFRQQYKSECGK